MKATKLFIKACFILSLTTLGFTSGANKANANVLSYCTIISDLDRYNTNGSRLLTAGDIIQQDRANYYKFKRRDLGDKGIGYFSTYNRRVFLNQMVQKADLNPSVRSAILYGGNVPICVYFNNVYISVNFGK